MHELLIACLACDADLWVEDRFCPACGASTGVVLVVPRGSGGPASWPVPPLPAVPWRGRLRAGKVVARVAKAVVLLLARGTARAGADADAAR